MEKAFSFDDLPTYIVYKTKRGSFYYHPTIIKYENRGLRNAYYGMYARYYPRTGKTNTEQVLFCVSATNFKDVLEKFIHEYNNNIEFVKDLIWFGDRPKIINLMNCSVDGYLMERNVNMPKL